MDFPSQYCIVYMLPLLWSGFCLSLCTCPTGSAHTGTGTIIGACQPPSLYAACMHPDTPRSSALFATLCDVVDVQNVCHLCQLSEHATANCLLLCSMIVDGVTGRVLHAQSAPGARGPAVAHLSENTAVVQLWDTNAARCGVPVWFGSKISHTSFDMISV